MASGATLVTRSCQCSALRWEGPQEVCVCVWVGRAGEEQPAQGRTPACGWDLSSLTASPWVPLWAAWASSQYRGGFQRPESKCQEGAVGVVA